MEARSQVTGEVVAQKTLEVTARTDYTWTIERPRPDQLPKRLRRDPEILHGRRLTNSTWPIEKTGGFSMSRLGNHFLAAFKAADGQEAASITVKVTENNDYSWGIGMIEGGSPVVIAGRSPELQGPGGRSGAA